MNYKFSLSSLHFILLLHIAIASVRVAASAAEPEFQVLTDMAGRRVTLSRQVKRIVALGPGALRFVAYLNALDLVVGIEECERRMSRSCWVRPYGASLPADFLKLPVIGPGGPGKLPDFERLMMCRPDLIILVPSGIEQTESLVSRTGVPTVVLSYGRLGVWGREAVESLCLLGRILNRDKRALELKNYIQGLEKDLAERTQTVDPKDRPRAYFGGISYKGAQGLQSTQSGYLPANMVNALNLADSTGATGHFFVDKEQIMVWNPDTIFVDMGSRSILERDFVEQRQFYFLLKAFCRKRVFSLLPYNYYNTNIEIALINSFFIGKCLYPDFFQDVEMQVKTSEILSQFLGIDAPGHVPAYDVVVFPAEGPVQWGRAQ